MKTYQQEVLFLLDILGFVPGTTGVRKPHQISFDSLQSFFAIKVNWLRTKTNLPQFDNLNTDNQILHIT